jgi:hypothetical protein
MDARDFYLSLHHHNHFLGKAQRILEVPTEEQYRTVLPEHNSIAWVLWHIARGEDWTVQTILQGREQLLTRDSWDQRMRVTERGFGGGMSRADMITLTERIDIEEMLGYYRAVAESSQHFFRGFDFDTLNERFEVEGRLALAPDAVGPDPRMRKMMLHWKMPKWWVEVMTVVDVAFHVEEGEHVLRLIKPDHGGL